MNALTKTEAKVVSSIERKLLVRRETNKVLTRLAHRLDAVEELKQAALDEREALGSGVLPPMTPSATRLLTDL